MLKEQISFIQKSINAEMVKRSIAVNDGKKTATSLIISGAFHDSFVTPRVGDTGTQYNGLVVLYLALIKLTNLPLLVHDSFMLKHIVDESIKVILHLYSKIYKQLFIALFTEGSYTEVVQKIMEKTKILQLSTGKSVLFSRTWNDGED